MKFWFSFSEGTQEKKKIKPKWTKKTQQQKERKIRKDQYLFNGYTISEKWYKLSKKVKDLKM